MDKKEPTIKNIVEAFKVLDYVNESGEAGIAEIAAQLNLSKSTIFRIVKSLETVRALKQEANSQYRLDYHLTAYAHGATRDSELATLAEPYMQTVMQVTGETVNLGIRYEKDVIIAKSVDGDFYQLQTTLLPVSPLYCSGLGKLFLSRESDHALRAYFQALQPRTIKTITSFQAFKPEQAKILANGLSTDEEEYEYGLSCIAVPIEKNKQLVCGLSVSGPTSRLKHKGLNKITAVLQEQAALFAKDLAASGITFSEK
ncbi:IclR family transcriptional regulator [Loigolactobacillus binensis]|uniref:IclR family transcriptional regulator n=1 Tax=Loigolactobacillus binensis TaxID=2559922 RepID=A0ABW3E7R5_9LACO|nr:IclR family transcriptional regulator [Loigolactobacillus binensis]